jgi:ATP-binding cassette subfamily C protein CydC
MQGETLPALVGVDLELAPGERVLVRGGSGAGKTTLAHVLVRFLDYEGSYRLDGVEASALDPRAVRRLVGLVEQRPWLFDEDLRQNLIFARDTATDEELLEVLERVGLRDWVEERGGLDARVGERGALVSGGQAQRIALARAMLADFPVLVLDEPTANVDADRADALLADLADAASRAGRTVVLISHAPVDESLVDRVVRLSPSSPLTALHAGV